MNNIIIKNNQWELEESSKLRKFLLEEVSFDETRLVLYIKLLIALLILLGVLCY